MIQTTSDIIKLLETDDIEFVSKMLNDLVEYHRRNDGKRTYDLWRRYRLEGVPIKQREPAAYEKVDRRTANDFFADIVDTKTGYMGNEVTVGLEREAYKTNGEITETRYDDDRRALRMFQVRAASEDLNSEQVRNAAAMGIGYRLLYVDNSTGEVKMKNLPAYEVIYIHDRSIDDPQLVLRYYTMEEKVFEGGKEYKRERTVVEWYDETNVQFFIDDGEGNYSRDISRGDSVTDEDGNVLGTGVQPHLFNGIPVIAFPNNELLTAEPEKVIDLIDTYDAIMSATSSEIEQLRLAYMFVKGAGLDLSNAYIKQLEQTGIFALPEEGEVGFIDKQLADAAVHNILVEIRKNIYQFAKSIDMSKDFGGEMRVIGWQVALLNLENSAKITERKFTRALRKQYDLLSEYWRGTGVMLGAERVPLDIDPMDLEFTFTRNFPRDLRAEAETLQLLLNTVSTETAFAQMSFIDDPEAEMKRIDNEQSPYRGQDGDEGFSEEQPPDREADRQSTGSNPAEA